MLSIFDKNDIIDILSDFLRGLFAFLCDIIYPGIASLYNLFIEMGTLIYTDEFSVIYNKISLIIGIFMVFKLSFWLIEALVNPDSMKDKEKAPAKIIQKVLVSVIMLAMTPTIFETAMDIQNKIVNSHIIENVISIGEMPTATVNGKEISTGNYLAAELFTNFYTANTEKKANGDVVEYNHKCIDHYVYQEGKNSGLGWSHYEKLLYEGNLENLNNYCLTERVNPDEDYSSYIINFNGLFATAVGGFVFWMILMYCISLGTRFVQLIFLQVIAPVPIMCNLMPGKDNMFSKWIKQCTTTYLDLFIRLVIINFVMLLCRIILGNSDSILTGLSFDNVWVEIFLVLGLLTFAKKAPDLIQELLPKSVTKASGDFGLSLKKRTDSMIGGKLMYNTMKRAPGYAAGGLAGAAVGGVMGAIGGKGVGSRIMGGISGATKGFGTGSKKGSLIKNIGDVKKNQAAQNSKLQQWRIASEKGENDPNTFGDWMSRRSDATRKAMGIETVGAARKRDTEFANQAAGSYKNMIDFGVDKALEKNKKLNAFGKNIGIAELDAIQKSATTEYQQFSAEKLLTTEEGKLKLKNIVAGMNNEQQQQVENIKNNFIKGGIKADEAEKLAQAEVAVEQLRTKAIEAEQEFKDSKKEAGFIHLVEEYAKGKDTNVINEFKVMNAFLKLHPDIAEQEFGLKEPKDGREYLDPETMNELYEKANSGDKAAQTEFEELFKSFDKFKTLKALYVAKNNSPEALRDKANDQYNGK